MRSRFLALHTCLRRRCVLAMRGAGSHPLRSEFVAASCLRAWRNAHSCRTNPTERCSLTSGVKREKVLRSARLA